MSRKHKTQSEELSLAELEEVLQQVNRRGRTKNPDTKFWQNPSTVFDRVGVVLQSQKASREEQDSALQVFLAEAILGGRYSRTSFNMAFSTMLQQRWEPISYSFAFGILYGKFQLSMQERLAIE